MVKGAIPLWLPMLLREKFFDPCLLHQSAKKNDKNIFCLNCCLTICPHCLPLHRPHRRLQIRRYVYQDVVRLSEAQKLINCTLVQTYTTNSAKVVFLNERPMSRPFRGSANFCIKCDRSLQHPFLFCSISCKVKHLETAMHGGKEVEQDYELIPFYFHKARSECDAIASFEKEQNPQMTPDSVLNSPVSPTTCSASASASGVSTNILSTGNSNVDSATKCKSLLLACTVATRFLTEKKKKRTKRKKGSLVLMRGASCRSRASQAGGGGGGGGGESISRRKGVPHRSPLN